MARNSKKGKESKGADKLIAEDKVTEKKNEERHLENVETEEKKVEAAKAESDNQAPPVATVSVPDKERKARFDALLEDYAKKNPVKFAEKKKRGEFDKIPANFSGGNALHVTS